MTNTTTNTTFTRRTATLVTIAMAALLPGLSLAQTKLKVAGIYTVPFEQQWVGRLHTALKAAEARGEIEYKGLNALPYGT